jgi:hypothetical protein
VHFSSFIVAFQMNAFLAKKNVTVSERFLRDRSDSSDDISNNDDLL